MHGFLQSWLLCLGIKKPNSERFLYFHKELAEYYTDLKFDDEKMIIYLPNGRWFEYKTSYFNVCSIDPYDNNVINEDPLDMDDCDLVCDNHVVNELIYFIDGLSKLE